MHPYRVFVCYSRADRPLARTLVGILGEAGLRAVWAESLDPGHPFPDGIRRDIAHAHVLLPLLTEGSAGRPWVHQEMGYAMALRVPILPVAVGKLPEGLAHLLRAVEVGREQLRELSPQKLAEDVHNLVQDAGGEPEATFRPALRPVKRAELLGHYAREATRHEAHGPFRQRGALTSLNLPREPADHPIWRQRDGRSPRSEDLYEKLREERLAIEAYVREHGCRLTIDPSIPFAENGPAARRVRLATLLEFLKDTTVRDVRVAVRERGAEGNLTIEGDWFLAESVTPRPGKGYYHTIFTCHAPTIVRRTRQFDLDFALFLERSGAAEATCRQFAVEAVERAIAEIAE